MAHPKDLVQLHQAWAHDPSRFDREVLKFEPSNQQEKANEELAKLVWSKIYESRGERRIENQEFYATKQGISIMSGKGTGKDWWVASKIYWFLTCFPNPLIPSTATTGHQLQDILWRYLSEMRQNSEFLRSYFEWHTTKLYLREKGGESHFAIARTANPKGTAEEQTETLSGFHAPYMMIPIDEASGIPEPVFKPLEGTLTGECNFILMIFNPTRAGGFAVESHKRFREYWVTLQWNSEHTVFKDEVLNKALKASIEFKAKKFGRDSNQYRIEVLGLPPISGTDTLIPYDWAIDAIDRDVVGLEGDKDILAGDVGGGGDPSVCLRRCGPRVFPIEQNDTADSEQLIGWYQRQIITYDPAVSVIDAIGIGWAVSGALRQRCPNHTVIGIMVSEVAAEDNRFFRLRDELAWRVREEFERREISIPDDPMLIGELTTIKFDDSKGPIKIEAKKEMKKRGVDSPNRFDALCLTEYLPQNYVRQMAKRYVDFRSRRSSVSWKTV